MNLKRASKQIRACVLGAFCAALVPGTSFAGAPPSGEPPRSGAQDKPSAENEGGRKPKEPLITTASRQAMLTDLYDQLSKTKAPEAAQPIIAAIWKVWTFSGSATSDVLLERARDAAMETGGAETLNFLNAVVELQPDFAQGWFLRAMTYKLQRDSHRMLGDLRRTLALDPRHFEALKALAFELNELGRKKQAIEAYDKMLEVYPAAATSPDPILQGLTRDLAGQGI